MSGTGREAFAEVLEARPEVSKELPEVLEALTEVWEWSDVRERSGGPPGCLGVVRRLSQMSETGREAFAEVLEALPEVSEAFSEVSVALPNVREWLGGPPICPGVVGRPPQKFGSSRE